jgi:hypothetical protein
VQVVSAETDLADRFEVVVDPDGEPADFDEAILTFLERVVEQRLEARKAAGQQADQDGQGQGGEKQ